MANAHDVEPPPWHQWPAMAGRLPRIDVRDGVRASGRRDRRQRTARCDGTPLCLRFAHAALVVVVPALAEATLNTVLATHFGSLHAAFEAAPRWPIAGPKPSRTARSTTFALSRVAASCSPM